MQTNQVQPLTQTLSLSNKIEERRIMKEIHQDTKAISASQKVTQPIVQRARKMTSLSRKRSYADAPSRVKQS